MGAALASGAMVAMFDATRANRAEVRRHDIDVGDRAANQVDVGDGARHARDIGQGARHRIDVGDRTAGEVHIGDVPGNGVDVGRVGVRCRGRQAARPPLR